VATILGKLKNTFLPSSKVAQQRRNKIIDTFAPTPEVSKARRIDTFGTESKLVATGAIALAAGAAIAAPAVVARAGGLAPAASKAGSAIARTAIANPGKAAVAGIIAAPAIAGALRNDPKVVTRTAGGLANFQGNIYEAFKDPSKENFANIIKENPVISGIAAGGALLTAGAAGAALSGTANLFNTTATRENTKAIKESISGGVAAIPANNIQSVPLSTGTPMTPQTQALSTVGPRSVSRSRKKKAPQQIRQSVRVNIINASRLGNKTYIRKYA